MRQSLSIYQWSFVSRHRHKSIAYDAFYGAIMAIAIVALLYLIDYLIIGLSVWIAYLMLFVPIFLIIRELWGVIRFNSKIKLVDPILWQVANGAVIYLITSETSLASQGFDLGHSERDVFSWSLFVIDNVLSVLLFDIPEIYDLRLSSIVPESSLAKFINVIFRFSLAAGFIDLIYHSISDDHSKYHYSTKEDIIRQLELLPEGQKVHIHGKVEMMNLVAKGRHELEDL